MVRINSESSNESEFADFMMKTGNILGTKSWKDAYGNVYLFVDGKGDGIMLNTHMDTVSPGNGINPRVHGEYITSDGSTILGADSKAGIAAMVEVLTILKESGRTHRPVLITLSCNEEVGIPTAQHIVSDIKLCVVPDRGTPVGEIITEAPYAQVYEVAIHGEAVYAPTHYKHGKHAIMAAVEMIKALPLGDIDEYTTTNIGIITGGRMTSMVPEDCVFKGNCYSFSKESFERFLTTLDETVDRVNERYGTTAQVRMLEYFGGYKIDRADPLVKLVDTAMRNVQIDPVYQVYKAVTNANLLNDAGIKSVLISTGVENQHTVNERVSIRSLEQITQILQEIVTMT